MSTNHDPLAPTVHAGHVWLRAVADTLDTDDRRFALRALRAWLHTVRDRIGVDSSAHLSAQLPELLRGIYYENWVPSHVPVRHNLREFYAQFAREAGIDTAEVPAVVAAVTYALDEQFSPGLLARIFAGMPITLYRLLYGVTSDIAGELRLPDDIGAPDQLAPDRLTQLEQHMTTLTEAVVALAHGLEQLPTDSTDSTRTAEAARRAHDLLLAGGFGANRRPA
ncbi:DUF2267 domain-containing protein [Nocardia rhizosphaerihabitans]|uniref:DUF2267 domain-containing protein n=1 Tax=Nocardia rhizosphaerihabitans TaxID=1691570 RepID=A0ABQ2KCV8_9NOCA|nr:DUF2267 domain-containing protein [Nocardia rhizosphaerihabitans]GGN79407.1 hypothetical protein GCM10011610_27790 [Nocardia rhizosphaerihabitans]